MEIFIQILGWVGTLLIVLAYYLSSHKKINIHETPYKLMNLVGAICIGINVFHQSAWPSVALQSIWALVAISSLFRETKK